MFNAIGKLLIFLTYFNIGINLCKTGGGENQKTDGEKNWLFHVGIIVCASNVAIPKDYSLPPAPAMEVFTPDKLWTMQ